MKKILKFLKCKNISDVEKKMAEFEINEEIQEFKELMNYIVGEKVKDKDVATLTGKADLIRLLRSDLGFMRNEAFKVVFLNTANNVIAEEILFRGTVDRSTIYPRVIVEKTLAHGAKSVIFAHNHPSGNLTPSRKDIELTKDMQEVLDLLDIRLLDHMIITKDSYYSFLEEGLLG